MRKSTEFLMEMQKKKLKYLFATPEEEKEYHEIVKFYKEQKDDFLEWLKLKKEEENPSAILTPKQEKQLEKEINNEVEKILDKLFSPSR